MRSILDTKVAAASHPGRETAAAERGWTSTCDAHPPAETAAMTSGGAGAPPRCHAARSSRIDSVADAARGGRRRDIRHDDSGGLELAAVRAAAVDTAAVHAAAVDTAAVGAARAGAQI